MKKLTVYLVRNIMVYFIILEISFTFLYIIIDLIGKLDNFVSGGVSIGIIIKYFLSKAPIAGTQIAPVATLLSTSIFVTTMARRNEIVALKSSGISSFHIKVPILVLSFFITWTAFIISEFVAPMTQQTVEGIWAFYVEKGQTKKTRQVRDRVWHRAGDLIFYCDRFVQGTDTVERPLILFFDESFQPRRHILAKRAFWTGDGWLMEDLYEQRLDINGEVRSEHRDAEKIVIPITPESLSRAAPDPLMMNVFELKRFAEKVSSEGYDATPYNVDFHLKLSFPFMHIILAFIGSIIPLLLRKPGYPLVIFIGICVCFLYLVMYGIFRSIAVAGILDPMASMWFPNLTFSILGYYLSTNEV